MNIPGISDPAIYQAFNDAFEMAAPVLRVVVPITVTVCLMRTTVQTVKNLCMSPRRVSRQEIQEANARRLALATARRIAEETPPPFHVCDGCANCPISKDTGLTEEKCHLFGTASCLIGQHIDERGGICE